MRRLKAWLIGYVIVCIRGGDIARFLALLSHHGILVTKTLSKEQGVFLQLSLEDFRRIRPFVRKTHVRVHIYRRVGFPFFIDWCRRHIGFCVGCLLYVLLLMVLQRHVWLINVDGNYVRTDEQIIDALREEGVYVGCLMGEVTCSELEEYLRNTMSDIIWVSCEKDGTKLRVHVKEAYHYPERQSSDRETGDIVATADGVVTELVVRRGVPLVRVGDHVNAGDVLVSGTQIITDSYDVELSRSYLLADADVKIQSTVTWEDGFSLTYESKEYREKKRKRLAITAFGHEILKYKSSIPSDSCDIMTSYADLKLFSRLYLPVRIQVTSYERYDIVQKEYSEEEASALLREHYMTYLENLILDGYELLEERLQMTIGDGEAHANASISVSRSAWEYKDIVIEEDLLEEAPNETEDE